MVVVLTAIGRFADVHLSVLATGNRLVLLRETPRKLNLTHFYLHWCSFGGHSPRSWLLVRIQELPLRIRRLAIDCSVLRNLIIELLDFGVGEVATATWWSVEAVGSTVLLVLRIIQPDLILRQGHLLGRVDPEIWLLLLSGLLRRRHLNNLHLGLILNRRLIRQVQTSFLAQNHLFLEAKRSLLVR